MNCKQCLNKRTDQVKIFISKIGFPKDIVYKFISVIYKFISVVYKFQCGLCSESYYGEFVRHLNIRTDDDIGISSLTRKQIKRKNSSLADHFPLCNHSAPYGNFEILARENNRFLLKVKKRLLILRDKSSLKRNITSSPLYLFDRPQ